MPSSQDEATWGDLVYAAQAGIGTRLSECCDLE